MRDLSINVINVQDVWWSDEAHGDGNTKMLRIWSGFYPETVDKLPLQSPKLTIGMHLAISAQGIIGSFLFESSGTSYDHQNESKNIEQGF